MNVINYYQWTFVQVTKEEAKKAYNRGSYIVMCPNKTMPFSCDAPTTRINKKFYSKIAMKNNIKPDFLNLCNVMQKAHCNEKTGKRLAFYVKANVTNLK